MLEVSFRLRLLQLFRVPSCLSTVFEKSKEGEDITRSNKYHPLGIKE